MSDSYDVYYVFEDDLEAADVEQLVGFLNTEYDIYWPKGGSVEAYVDELTEGIGFIRVAVGDTGLTLFAPEDVEKPIDLPFVKLKIKEQFITPQEGEADADAVARMNEVYTFFGELYEEFVAVGRPPVYVVGVNFAEHRVIDDPDHVRYVSKEQVLDHEVPGMYWFQILPPAMVENLGEERAQSSPAFRLEELSDGGVLLAGTPGVLVSDRENYIEEAAEHLGVPCEP